MASAFKPGLEIVFLLVARGAVWHMVTREWDDRESVAFMMNYNQN